MNLRLAPLLVLALLPFLVSFSKKPTATITFHAQGDPSDPSKTMFPLQIEGKMMIFKLVPEVSQQNVVAFHPFDTDTGDKGVALQLDFRGRESLYGVSRSRQGEVLLAMVNGKPVDYLVIDRVIDNGMITIWRGITDDVLKAMGKKYPLIHSSGAPTMNKDLDMAPVTKKEKRTTLKAAKEREKAEEKARKEGKPLTPEVPSLNAPGSPATPAAPATPGVSSPRSPTASSIPVEGATGNPPIPPANTSRIGEPPLPR